MRLPCKDAMLERTTGKVNYTQSAMQSRARAESRSNPSDGVLKQRPSSATAYWEIALVAQQSRVRRDDLHAVGQTFAQFPPRPKKTRLHGRLRQIQNLGRLFRLPLFEAEKPYDGARCAAQACDRLRRVDAASLASHTVFQGARRRSRAPSRLDRSRLPKAAYERCAFSARCLRSFPSASLIVIRRSHVEKRDFE